MQISKRDVGIAVAATLGMLVGSQFGIIGGALGAVAGGAIGQGVVSLLETDTG